jgi:hypothetical protein
MAVLDEIRVTLSAEKVVASRGQRHIRPELIQHGQEALALGQTLWQPMAVYDRFDVHAVDGEEVSISSSQGDAEGILHVGPKADLLSDARQLLIGVGSIGRALEEQVQELQASGESLKAYLLDTAGVLALGTVGEALRCLAEEDAARQSWGVSAALSPGSLVGWTLRGQRELCALLPLEEIGVRLNEHNVLEPFKSFSVVVGLGPGYETKKVGSVCRYCALKNTCWRRREDPS